MTLIVTQGTALILVENGKLLTQRDQIKFAILEKNGKISIIPWEKG